MHYGVWHDVIMQLPVETQRWFLSPHVLPLSHMARSRDGVTVWPLGIDVRHTGPATLASHRNHNQTHSKTDPTNQREGHKKSACYAKCAKHLQNEARQNYTEMLKILYFQTFLAFKTGLQTLILPVFPTDQNCFPKQRKFNHTIERGFLG